MPRKQLKFLKQDFLGWSQDQGVSGDRFGVLRSGNNAISDEGPRGVSATRLGKKDGNLITPQTHVLRQTNKQLFAARFLLAPFTLIYCSNWYHVWTSCFNILNPNYSYKRENKFVTLSRFKYSTEILKTGLAVPFIQKKVENVPQGEM